MICKIFYKPERNVRSGEMGFTIVEILATFVLIALIIPAVMEGISLSMKLGAKSKHQIEACALAQTKLAEFLLSGDYEEGDQEGDFEDGDYSEYTWRLMVDDWEGEDSMQQLTMAVGWTDSVGTGHSVQLATLVYRSSDSE